MSRATIDFGIDLGTSNSAIAVLVDGRPRVIRNNEQNELTPSVVMLNPRGEISVGQRAFRQADRRPASVAREFKRAMGTDRTFVLDNRTLTPEELSAEVLKELRADAERLYPGEVDAAVITVPAMFTLAACDATTRAATLAGLRQLVLLQEPIAAGLAYGFDHAETDGYLLVYDLGGGTFDISLLALRKGRLQVIDHGGDEFLGGKNFDDLLIDYVCEQLRADYRIDGLIRPDEPRHRTLYARLKHACEEGKIELSRSGSTVIDVSGVSDDDGQEIDTYIDLTRATYESLIEPLVSRTTRLMLDLLAANNLKPDRVLRTILVGGPTFTPLVRKHIYDATGIALATEVDPMTVVAQGAAVFAASLQRDAIDTTSRPLRGALSVELRYPPITPDAEVVVGGRVGVPAFHPYFVQIERGDGGWHSGRIPLNEGTFIATIVVRPDGKSSYRVRLFDDTGSELAVEPAEFTIAHGLATDRPLLSRSLGVAVDEGGREPSTLVLLPRATQLPANRQHVLRTTREVRPGEATGLNIHIVEGEARQAGRNDHVGYIRLDGSNVDRPVPVGSQVELTFDMDTSRRLSVKAFVPLLEATFDLTIQDVNRSTPAVEVLESQLETELDRLATVGRVVAVEAAPAQLQEVVRAVDEARGGDRDAALRAQRRLRELQAMLDEALRVSRLQLLQSEWRQLLALTRAFFAAHVEAGDRMQLLVLEREGEDAILAGDVVHLEQRVDQLRSIYASAQMSRPGFWVAQFDDLARRESNMTDPITARILLQEGRVALSRQDVVNLKKVCRRLWQLLPSRSDDRGGGLPDIGVRP